jgi:hypothetical protein
MFAHITARRPRVRLAHSRSTRGVDPVAGLQAAEQLHSGQVTLLVNLYERPDPPELLERLGAQALHLPVHNSGAPTAGAARSQRRGH